MATALSSSQPPSTNLSSSSSLYPFKRLRLSLPLKATLRKFRSLVADNLPTMPRRDFSRDLRAASRPSRFSLLSNVRRGEKPGSIRFDFRSNGEVELELPLKATVLDLESYPNDHSYEVVSVAGDVPSEVSSALEEVQPFLYGLSVADLLTSISEAIEKALYPADGAHLIPSLPEENGSVAGSANENGEDHDHYDSDWEDPFLQGREEDLDNSSDIEDRPLWNADEPHLLANIRRDLRAVKDAGFKVGYLGSLTGSLIVSVACRIAKLRISEEAMVAWKVEPQQYLVLLIRYPQHYLNSKQILPLSALQRKSLVGLRVAVCDSYKPTLGAAQKIFDLKMSSDQMEETFRDGDVSPKLTSLFIGESLHTLLNDRFTHILKARIDHGFSWTEAEIYFNNIQGQGTPSVKPPSDDLAVELRDFQSTYPRILLADHLTSSGNSSEEYISFPLSAMQFTLRHFARCTEFCLVCHCRLEARFEALKPYVCSKPLCLYQYMSLGFGPSIEWEVISQPYVVDLLVSFTYSAAVSCRLKEFPTGLGFNVPNSHQWISQSNPNHQNGLYLGTQPTEGKDENHPESVKYSASLNTGTMELIFPANQRCPPLRVGDWILVMSRTSKNKTEHEGEWHCRVRDAFGWPVIQLDQPVICAGMNPTKQVIEKEIRCVEFMIYDTNFDNLGEARKQASIVMLLRTLPDVDTMRSYLGGGVGCKRSLSSWKSRISPAALDVLRWIIASNRSCIIQDDAIDEEKPGSESSNTANDNLVSGMDDWVQFRFAQGAPDKEQRFIDAVEKVSKSLNPEHPTLFLWHGSPLYNWHSIVREGLHFREHANGRSCGNGVYLSPQFQTSHSFSCRSIGPGWWPHSRLAFSSAISLQEVVNAPSQFVHHDSHQLVVDKIEWIQTRYLFVDRGRPKSGNTSKRSKPEPSAILPRDPTYSARGPKGEDVKIPITALSRGRREGLLAKPEPAPGPSKRKATASRKIWKKIKKTTGMESAVETADSSDTNENTDNDGASVQTDTADREFLLSENEGVINIEDEERLQKVATWALRTTFRPGTLLGSCLPMLNPPEYATTNATKLLQKLLQSALRTQDYEPLDELGWYIDPDLINTVYQWIVELHTFDPSLPLAKDMESACVHSVVLEIRFPADFPMSPPFIRVIRPRFLPFQEGGGGHVTIGGAICMELLTNSGWSSASTMESVLLQVRLAISSTDPRPARLADTRSAAYQNQDYQIGEAVSAYIRACNQHGWKVPDGLQKLGWTAGA